MKAVSLSKTICTRSVILLFGLTLVACAAPSVQEDVSLNFSGKSTTTKSVVSGVATGAPYGEGKFVLKVSDGRMCDGFYRHKSRTNGFGLLTCQDASVGTFEFSSDGRMGGGKAILEGETFTFKFELA